MGLCRLTNDVYRDHVVPGPQNFRHIADQLGEHTSVLADLGSVDKYGANLRHSVETEGYTFARQFVRYDEMMPVPRALRVAPVERVRVKTSNFRFVKIIGDTLGFRYPRQVESGLVVKPGEGRCPHSGHVEHVPLVIGTSGCLRLSALRQLLIGQE